MYHVVLRLSVVEQAEAVYSPIVVKSRARRIVAENIMSLICLLSGHNGKQNSEAKILYLHPMSKGGKIPYR